MTSYRELYDWGSHILESAGVPEYTLDARLLLEEACGTDRSTLLAHPDRPVTDEEEKRFREWIDLRSERIPLQHLVGYQEFMGLRFCVSPDVLIPRQDTEILVEEALRRFHDGMRVLDLCCGSGCILISLMQYSNDLLGVGADLSEAALDIARKNGEKLLGTEKSQALTWCRGDLFDAVSGSFDMILSNPPYIAETVREELMPEVRDHDPDMALFGGEDGLDFYRRIAADAKTYLKPGGVMILEIGCDQAKQVTDLLDAAGYTEIETIRDYAGLDRVICARRPILF